MIPDVMLKNVLVLCEKKHSFFIFTINFVETTIKCFKSWQIRPKMCYLDQSIQSVIGIKLGVWYAVVPRTVLFIILYCSILG